MYTRGPVNMKTIASAIFPRWQAAEGGGRGIRGCSCTSACGRLLGGTLFPSGRFVVNISGSADARVVPGAGGRAGMSETTRLAGGGSASSGRNTTFSTFVYEVEHADALAGLGVARPLVGLTCAVASGGPWGWWRCGWGFWLGRGLSLSVQKPTRKWLGLDHRPSAGSRRLGPRGRVRRGVEAVRILSALGGAGVFVTRLEECSKWRTIGRRRRARLPAAATGRCRSTGCLKALGGRVSPRARMGVRRRPMCAPSPWMATPVGGVSYRGGGGGRW
jgi:fluoride ion exporter CrcB/FEX